MTIKDETETAMIKITVSESGITQWTSWKDLDFTSNKFHVKTEWQ